MKTRNLIYGAILLSIFSTSCSNPVYVQKDESANFSTYKTYAWVDTRANESDQSARATAYADISIHNAVNSELNKLGWREVTENPDVLVMYDILVEKTTQQQRDAVYSQPFPVCITILTAVAGALFIILRGL